QVTDANGCSASKEVVVSPAADSFACTINPPTNPIICNSAGNSLTSVVTDAQTYQWSVSSSDNSWVITNGQASSAIIFNAGNTGSSATFSLTFQKNGCTRTCNFEIASGCVVRDNTGGGDPASGDPCADSTVTTAIVIQPEPDTTAKIASSTESDPTFTLQAYPNPFSREVSFEWIAESNDYARLIIMDPRGKVIAKLFAGNVEKGEKYTASWSGDGFRETIYYYQYISSTQQKQGKLFKK
ncbi:MAG TPA: hypothetical protein VFU05_00155, partial [Cyclobacteriaceae bacterium]|nr:hypothetical protein [Cyclobacteriaceae bacterium]